MGSLRSATSCPLAVFRPGPLFGIPIRYYLQNSSVPSHCTIRYFYWGATSPTFSKKQCLHISAFIPLVPHGTISKIYPSLNALDFPAAASYKSQWEQDLASFIDTEGWNKGLFSIAKCSFNMATHEATYKVIPQWYWVSARIASLNPSYCDRCFRGCGQQGYVAHVWWFCPHLTRVPVQGFRTTLFLVPYTHSQGYQNCFAALPDSGVICIPTKSDILPVHSC